MFKSKSYWSVRRHVSSLADEHIDQMEQEINYTAEQFPVTADESELICQISNSEDVFGTMCNDDDDLNECYFDAECCVVDESESSSCVSDNFDDYDLPKLLAEWAITFNISLSALGTLLGLLVPYHPQLPIDPRTLLHTPRSTAVKQLADGETDCHIGIAHSLKLILDESAISNFANESVLKIQLNIDGLPIFKSSGLQLWPILGILKGICDSKPFTIGVYAGNKKPTCMNNYLDEFIKEASELERSGIDIHGRVFHVEIHSIVCDAPARSLIKGTKGHTAYYGCDRCKQRGEWRGKMTYPETDAPLRSNTAFDEMLDREHHREKSP